MSPPRRRPTGRLYSGGAGDRGEVYSIHDRAHGSHRQAPPPDAEPITDAWLLSKEAALGPVRWAAPPGAERRALRRHGPLWLAVDKPIPLDLLRGSQHGGGALHWS